MTFSIAGVLLFRQHSKGCWELADAMVAVLVSGDVSVHKPVDCSEWGGYPSDLGISRSFL